VSTVPKRLGKYELQELLGRGGMAEVWKALDIQLQRYVAIKLLQANLQADPDFITRFIREAQVVAALRHPNIVQIYDFHISEEDEAEGPAADAVAYMVMEYVKGSTLAHYIASTSYKKQFPSAAEIVRLFTPISLAIDYAHRQGMIHRDIKPANILLDQSHTTRNPMGEPILSDFGLAKLLNAASQTVTGALLGTPLYISPEQVQNRAVSDQTDIYALGVVLYEVFTGVPPFRGENLSGVMMQHLLDTPTEPHLMNLDLPPALSKVLLKSLAKDPVDRFPNAATMIAAIAEALDIPVPQDVQDAISSTKDRDLPAVPAQPSRPSPTITQSEVVTSPSSTSSDVSLVVPPEAETVLSEGSLLPVKAEAISGPIRLPDSETHLNVPEEKTIALARQNVASVQEEQSTQKPSTASAHVASDEASVSDVTPAKFSNEISAPAPDAVPAKPSETTPPLLSPPPTLTFRRRPRWQVALTVLIIGVLLVSGLGAFFLLSHRSTGAPGVVNASVGLASFVSSGQVDMTTNQGSNDEFQINLHNIPDPQSGKSYYAWLLPDTSQVEAAPILLGKVSVNHGTTHFLYSGDDQHSNLLAVASRFLITEESASIAPSIPSPDLSTWRYYAELPQKPAPGQTYSLLDHLRHLLAIDPTLEALHLHGGLNIWTYRNTQSIQNWAGSARDGWSKKDFALIHRQVISILDYLDGTKLVQQDVPSGTPILANQQIAQVGLLEIKPGQSGPPAYLYHIALHLDGVLSSPGSTPYQRNLATQINTGINNVNGWLGQLRHDAIQLARMKDAQLALPSSLALLNDMVTQSTNAYQGRNNPATGQQQIGVAQIYRLVQLLAAFEVKPYK
jgi:serine/threonine protein kinase